MRIVVASDSIGALSSAQAGAVLADGWRGADATVVPMGESGRGFSAAMADQLASEVTLLVARQPDDFGGRVATCVDASEALIVGLEPESTALEPARGIDYSASSIALGRAVRQAIVSSAHHAGVVVVDLAWNRGHDGGAGFLAGLGAYSDRPLDAGVAGLGSATFVDLDPVRELLGDRLLVGIAPNDEIGQPLLGLRGITSLKGRAANEDAEKLLATDAALELFASLCNPAAATAPGAGAAGGVGFAINALGGRLCTGPGYAAEHGRLADAVRTADLVVTGCIVFDFASRGGGVLAEAAKLAETALRPCIAIAGEVLIGGREMRTMGIESAYPVRESSLDRPVDADVSAEELARTVARVARSWSW